MISILSAGAPSSRLPGEATLWLSASVRYVKGIIPLVCLTETNKQQNASVVEVCLPNQWIAYQMFIARLERVYYLDPPVKYTALRETYPHIQVWPFSHFFSEADTIGTRV
jgi:hypothetical protein